MKILVSSKGFVYQITRAITNKSHVFHVSGGDSIIEFIGNEKYKVSITSCVGHSNYSYSGVFSNIQWKRIIQFLRHLEEQPIIINFTEYMHTDIHEPCDIEVYGFYKKF